jgi:hypothetical protein
MRLTPRAIWRGCWSLSIPAWSGHTLIPPWKTHNLEEVRGQGDRIMVLVRTPGIDRYRAYNADDRNYNVLTVRDDQIVAIRDCRDREEALAVAGIEQR